MYIYVFRQLTTSLMAWAKMARNLLPLGIFLPIEWGLAPNEYHFK
jgi:hypothetical protein